MLTESDKKQIESRGMTVEQVEHQLEQIAQGFPFLRIQSAAAAGNGIRVLDVNAQKQAQNEWEKYKNEGHEIVKFVPASGAASRMFKDLFAFLNADYATPQTEFEKEFFTHFRKFAFHHAFCGYCKKNLGMGFCKLAQAGAYKQIVNILLGSEYLNYGQLPKGLLLFHDYEDGARTSMEEHLVEAALYAESKGSANIHFTVSHNHLELFTDKVSEKIDYYGKKYGVVFNVELSEQKQSTDTIAANMDNSPFRNEDGTLLFRPGGHGALIENLNDIDADIIFIKNIDNVVPDRYKGDTVKWKQIIAGILVETQRKVFDYLKILESGNYNRELLEEMLRFVQYDLCCQKPDAEYLENAELARYLKTKLNRPIRVCGVVRNIGEPGGGPFNAYNQDGTISLQILESSQIDKNKVEYQKMFAEGTHFNPVDLVCATKNYKGEKFNLLDFVDRNTGFISNKSKDGRELKALELPGLWNGAMSDWNTIFVEVPLTTFNPVKTVNDLLRDVHQS